MRLTDDELTALLADLDGLYAALKETRMPMTGLEEAYPKLRRLATEVRDLQAVVSWFKDNREATYNDLEQAALCGEGPLARYEEGGR